MGHLVTEDGELVHHHFSLISAVYALVGKQASGCDHVRRHAVADEEKYVLRLPDGCKIADEPIGDGLGTIVVGQGGCVFTSFVQGDFSISLGRHLDQGRFAGILGEQIWGTGSAYASL